MSPCRGRSRPGSPGSRPSAWLRMAAVSTISTMKVDRPRARSSAAPTRVNRRSTMPIRQWSGRHEAADLRHHGDQRVLAQEGGLARHVGAGQQPQPVVGRQIAVVGDEACTLGSGEHRLHHGMASGLDVELQAVVHHRPAIAALFRQFRQPGYDVEQRQRLRPPRRSRRRGAITSVTNSSNSVSSTASALSAASAILRSNSFSSTVVKRTALAERLAVDEGFRRLARHQLVGVGRRHLDIVAEHVVVPDLQARHAGQIGIARLHGRDQPAAFVPQRHQIVQLKRVSRRDEAAVAGQQRQFAAPAPASTGRSGRSARRRRHIGGLDPGGPRHRPGIGEHAAHFRRPLQPVAHTGEITRPAAAQRQARQARAPYRGTGAAAPAPPSGSGPR